MATALPGGAATLTAFLQGASPAARAGVGFAGSVALFTEILSFEAEYSRSREETGSPSFTLLSGSLMLSLPAEIGRFRPYVVTGLGIYRQSMGVERETSVATAEGLGLFVRIAGPLQGRFDYRAIQLRGDPLQEKQKRFYAGLALRL